jgi:phytanoyl-CoA hydroxylase
MDITLSSSSAAVASAVVKAAAALDLQNPTQAEPLLTDEQIRVFHERGYLAIPALLTPEQLRGLVDVYDPLFERKVGFDDGNFFDFAGPDDERPQLPQIVMPSDYEPAFRQSPLRRHCEALAKQLLGPTAEFVFDHVMMKPPAGGRATPWHQDQAFFTPKTRFLAVTFWIPLQDVDREMGCLKFIPGSNRGPLHRHRSIDNDPHTHGLEALDVDEQRAEYCPLRAGEATVHHWLTIHGADANITAMPRRVYAIAFGIPLERPLMNREYPWNRRKNTDRDARIRRSLTPWRRIKQGVRHRLVKMGLL